MEKQVHWTRNSGYVFVLSQQTFESEKVNTTTIIRDKKDRAEVNRCQNTIVLMSKTYNKPLIGRLLSLYHNN